MGIWDRAQFHQTSERSLTTMITVRCLIYYYACAVLSQTFKQIDHHVNRRDLQTLIQNINENYTNRYKELRNLD